MVEAHFTYVQLIARAIFTTIAFLTPTAPSFSETSLYLVVSLHLVVPAALVVQTLRILP
jgi:hypothetical protein